MVTDPEWKNSDRVRNTEKGHKQQQGRKQQQDFGIKEVGR
jgi:hypothetical protein